MSNEYARIRCYESDKACINDLRRGPEDTQADVIRRLLDSSESNAEQDNGSVPPDDLREQLDRIESAATTTEERTGRIEGTLEEMGAGR